MISTTLIHEADQPALRSILGRLLAHARHADFAIRRIRIAHIDLSAAELGPLHSCRVLVNRLDAGSLHDLPPQHAASHSDSLHQLLRFAHSGKLAVRVAPTAGWNPDFSILTNPDQPDITNHCLIGSHYFHEPDPPDGPAFTAVFHDPVATRLAATRFQQLWTRGYDVLPAVINAIENLALEPR